VITPLAVPNFCKDFDLAPYKNILYRLTNEIKTISLGVWTNVSKPPHVSGDVNFQISFGNINVGTSYANAYFRQAPCGNCGIMEVQTPYAPYLRLEHKQAFLKFIEAYSRLCKRSVLLGNDGVGKRVWQYIKEAGEHYNFIEASWNRNYSPDNYPHRVGIYYKNIGEYEYPDIYGLGTSFPDASNYAGL
jgi:hypothetical protein